jgi:hypothetical protein
MLPVGFATVLPDGERHLRLGAVRRRAGGDRVAAERLRFERNVVYEGEGGRIDHAELRYGDGLVMLGSERPGDEQRKAGCGWAESGRSIQRWASTTRHLDRVQQSKHGGLPGRFAGCQNALRRVGRGSHLRRRQGRRAGE